MRREVEWFVNHMERKLQANDYKGGWDQDSINMLYERLHQELYEVRDAIACWYEVPEPKILNNIIKEATDVANFAMMLADKAYRLLYEKRTTTTSPEAGDGQAEAGQDQ